MPELPEVETIRLSLEKNILGLTIKNIQILNAKSFFGDPKEIIGGEVIKVWRRAKVLGIDLSSSLRAMYHTVRGVAIYSTDSHAPPSAGLGMTLLFHLKMSGQVIFMNHESTPIEFVPIKSGSGSRIMNQERFVGGHPTKDMLSKMPNKHTRVIFEFSDGSMMYFNDQRKFGWVRVSDKAQVTSDKLIQKLGPEPLEDTFTWEVLKENLLKHKKTPVKVVILDQTVVAGVGNIYACEACFVAKIDPRIKVVNLTDKQIQALHSGIVRVLREGIMHGGSTRAHFVDAEGKKGLFLDHAYVYNRNGKPCKVCGTKIEKIKLGGRGTFFCRHCQKLTSDV